MITELTKEQEAQLEVYKNNGIKIGLDTNTKFNLNTVKSLCQKHRKICGIAPAKKFLVFDSPYAAMKEVEGITLNNGLYGQHDIHWLNYYMYYREVLGFKEETEKIVHLYELAKHVGWMWFGNETVVITRKPAKLHLREKNNAASVLHNENGMAVEYLDGNGVYALNGLRIPKDHSWVVTTPAEELKVNDIIKIKNTEIRSEVMKKVGVERMFSKLDKKLLDNKTYEVGGNYKLYEIDMGTDILRKYLSMYCPSKGSMHLEAVHPDCTSVLSCLNWRENGIISDDYVFPQDRT